MIDRDFSPPDPELELIEFIQDIASETDIYTAWLDKAATSASYSGELYGKQLRTIPDFLRHVHGIADYLDISFEVTQQFEQLTITKIGIQAPDCALATLVNESGLYTLQIGDIWYPIPTDALDTTFLALFGAGDSQRPVKELVRFMCDQAYQSTVTSVFEGIGIDDSSVKVSLVTHRESGQTNEVLEVVTTQAHPSSSFVGTRMMMYNFSDKSSRDTIVPPTSLHIDVRHTTNQGSIIVTSLRGPESTIPVARPTRYHEGNIIEALFALQIAAGSTEGRP